MELVTQALDPGEVPYCLPINPSSTISKTAMDCQTCSVLEAIRCDRIMKYVRLVEQMKRPKPANRSNAKLQDAIDKIQTELDEAWKRLAAHRAGHVFDFDNLQKCQYCGAETLLSNDGPTICENCAADLETGRKPPERQKSLVKAKAAIGE
jgi:hypothetical protein